MERTKVNGVLEDIGAEIGYTATSLLVAWFGGANLYVPEVATDDHPVARLIGSSAFKRLVAAYSCETLWIPSGHMEAVDHRNRLIAGLVHRGKSTKEIAEQFGISERRVQQLCLEVKGKGLLPLIMREAQGMAGMAIPNSEEKAEAENRIPATVTGTDGVERPNPAAGAPKPKGYNPVA